MRSEELITKLSTYLRKSILASSDIKIENGISLLLPNSLSRQNGAYICYYKTFLEMASLKTLPSYSTFFVVNCSKEPNDINFKKDSSYLFLNCTFDELSLILSDIFEKNKQLIDQSNYIEMQNIWKELINMAGTTEEILAKTKEFLYPFHSFVACIVLTPKHEYAKLSSTDILLLLDELNDFFPKTNIFPYKNQIIILYSQDSRPINTLSFSYNNFSSILGKYNMNASISNACRHPHMFPTLYHTSASSLKLGTKISSINFYDNIYQYEEFSTYYIIDLCVKEFIRIHGHSDIIYLVSPCIIELYRYDTKHNSDLLTTLFQYLLNGCNVAATAKILYMHRNTVFNKLHKINSIITLPLDNGGTQFKLLMSCFIVTYYREYLQKNI